MRPTSSFVLAFVLLSPLLSHSALASEPGVPIPASAQAEAKPPRSGDAVAKKATPEERATRKAQRAERTAAGRGAAKASGTGQRALSKEERRVVRRAVAPDKRRASAALLAESFASGAPAGWTYSPQGEGSGVCTLVCPDDATVPNDPGACSATITLPVPYPVGSCGPVTCSTQVLSPRGGLMLAPRGEGTGDCCASNGTPGCSDGSCEAAVCVVDSFCCDTAWDSICATEAASICSVCGGGETLPVGTTPIFCVEEIPQRAPTGLPPVSSCCIPTGSSGCDDSTCQATVCAIDSFCCQTAWDSICVGEAQELCSPLCGTSNSCSFDLTVQDVEPPQLTVPADISVGTDAPACAATVEFAVGASDNCPGVGVPSCDPSAGSSFALGTNPVACTVSDAAGNGGAGGFAVNVFDDDPPALVCPADIFAQVPPGVLAWPVSYDEPTPTDNCPGATAGCAPPSGSDFPVGTTTTTCVATDGAGLTAGCDFDVTVASATIQEIPTASRLGLAALAALLAGAALLVLRRPG